MCIRDSLKGEYPTVENSHTIPDEHLADDHPVVLAAEPGDVAVIHVLVVHKAGHNYTKTSRHKIINEYKTQKAVDRWGNRCAFAGLPLTRNGEIVTHPV